MAYTTLIKGDVVAVNGIKYQVEDIELLEDGMTRSLTMTAIGHDGTYVHPVQKETP